MSKEERKGFIDQIGEPAIAIITIIVVVILLYVFQAVVNIMNFLSNNPWVGWLVFGVICVIVVLYILVKFGIIFSSRNGFKLDVGFLKSLPIEVREGLEEAQGNYRHGHNRSCSVMLRATLEAAIAIRFKKDGKAQMIMGKNLPQKIELAKQEHYTSPSIANKLNQLKWIGDLGAHDYKVQITKEDLEKGFQTLRITLEHMFHNETYQT